jgi:hypothetical protein
VIQAAGAARGRAPGARRLRAGVMCAALAGASCQIPGVASDGNHEPPPPPSPDGRTSGARPAGSEGVRGPGPAATDPAAPGGPPDDDGGGPLPADRRTLTPPPAPPPLPAGDCSGITDAVITRQVEHLAAGAEITVRFVFRDGVPIAGRDVRGCVKLEDRAGKPVGVAVERRPLDAAHLLVLVDPGQTFAELQAAREAVRALVARRPPTERVAVYRWGAEVTQVMTSMAERRLLEARLQLMPAEPRPRKPLEAALVQIAPTAAASGGTGRDALRAVVVVSPRRIEAPTRPALEALGSVLALWWVGNPAATAFGEVPPGLRFEPGPAGERLLAERLDQYKQSAHVALGYCGPGAGLEAQLRVAGAAAPRPFEIIPALGENLAGRCDHAAVAQGRRNFTRRIELLFTPEQKAAAERAFGTRNEFAFQARPSPEHLPVNAAAHYRGNSSFRCRRQNYSLQLAGKRPRFLLPSSAQTRFSLISMCLDRFYLRTPTMSQILGEEGLFPGPFEIVELAVDGQSAGVYFFAEDTAEWFRQQFTGIQGVIRRNSAGGSLTKAEVEWSIGAADTAVASYQAILTSVANMSGPTLETGLRARLDLDRYLTWIALMTAFMNGDYVDEAFFVASQVTDAGGRPADFHGVFTWDPDDVFNPCHSGGRNAIQDAYGLLYCTEAELDRRIFADEQIYRRYVEILDGVLQRTPRKRFEDALGRTIAKLLSFFQDPRTLGAMTEMAMAKPGSTASFEAARATLLAEGAALLERFDQNRAALLARIADFRAGRPPPRF